MDPVLASQTDFSQLPISQGKTKALWDAIRSAPDPNAPGMPPGSPVAPPPQDAAAPQGPPPPVMAPPQPPIPPQQNIGPVGGSQVVPDSVASQVTTPTALATASPGAVAGPTATPAPPTPGAATAQPLPMPNTGVDSSQLPSAQRVGQLQAQVDRANKKPTLLGRLGNAAPALIGAGLAAAFHAPSAVQGVAEGENKSISERDARRQSLVQQLDAANQTRAQEYSALQRAQEMRDITQARVGGQEQVAQTNAGARRDVASTNVGGREQVAQTQGQTARDVAQVKGGFQLTDAQIAARARVESGKYAADAANGRLTRTLNASAGRQEAGFTHTDSKPTADEDRRSDLSEATKSYASELEDIATRRPELFGPLAGRVTQGMNTIGSNDPDVASISRIKHNLGLTSQAAHAFRSSAHIGDAADAMANTNQTAPALIENLHRATKGLDTFSTYERPTLKSRTAGPASKAPAAKANDPLGIR